MKNITKIIYVIIDCDGNTKNSETGCPYGFFLENEEELAKRWCERNKDLGFSYKKKIEKYMVYQFKKPSN